MSKPADRIAGEEAYVTDAYLPRRKEVSPGTRATPASRYDSFLGTIYDWAVDGLDGEWVLGGTWTEGES